MRNWAQTIQHQELELNTSCIQIQSKNDQIMQMHHKNAHVVNKVYISHPKVTHL